MFFQGFSSKFRIFSYTEIVGSVFSIMKRRGYLMSASAQKPTKDELARNEAALQLEQVNARIQSEKAALAQHADGVKTKVHDLVNDVSHIYESSGSILKSSSDE